MVDKLDPHCLVALMSHAFKGNQDGRSRSIDPISVNPEYGITNSRETSERTFPILDAIASISVSQERSQVVAVGLKLNAKEQEIRLIIAENNDVEPRLVAHIQYLWSLLQALSDECAANRGGLDRDEDGSPDIPEDVALLLRIKIFREIYQFSLQKEMKRVSKWWDPLLNFVKELVKRRGDALQGFESDLFDVLAALNCVRDLIHRLHPIPAQGLTDDEWERVYNYSMWANEKVGLVLADRNSFGCEILAAELNDYMQGYRDNRQTPSSSFLIPETSERELYEDSPSSSRKEAFRLRRALEKLTSLTRHIECLITFANSPRLRPALQYDMSICTVPGEARTVQLPGSQQQWKEFMEIAAGKVLPWQEDVAATLAHSFNERVCVCRAHCECTLVQYLATSHGESWDHVPAFTYIGVSKLSCSACSTWLDAFNDMGQRRFHTRGSHRKWYWPWGMPKEEEPLEEVIAPECSREVGPDKLFRVTLARKISRQYVEHLKEQRVYRSGSDSTTASLSRGKRHLSNAQIESVRSRLAAVTKKFRGTIGRHLDSMSYQS
ncbi:unnamed protein product [Tuber aestivum]|uniref:Uncharacterized protein n=1 Tax=Tuber aestivum TaxID=59557 RepID=A0A292Q7F2_9PEZI|nr:unnamed protein product [Tuber aestivum]